MFKFIDIIKFTSSDVDHLAKRTMKMHSGQIFEGKDVNGNEFKKYSKSYKKRKAAGKYKNQISTQVSPPNLTLTGNMLHNMTVLKTNYQTKELKFTYGYKKNRSGTKFFHNNKTRTMVDDQALGPLVEDLLVRDFADNIAKNLERMTKTKFVVKIT
tara:strand:- start:672 stop:1139 length:468 start_codon:yes stop_codon:yes gene_type:complete